MSPLLGIYGIGGCGRGIMPFAHRAFRRSMGPESRVVFVDDQVTAAKTNGHSTMDLARFLATPAAARYMCIAIADPRTRARVWERCESSGIMPWTAVAESTVFMDDIALGAGAAISPFVTLASNIRIGRHFHANLYSYVEHDCVIGDFVTFAPGAKCNGNVVVEDYVYLGSGAMIRQGSPGAPVVIGTGAIIGMGAVVLDSVAPGSVMVGNPARRIR
jgi:sugar O-acyltransferase (sialic acid O-acetyltransferase NeuD family)